MGGRLPQGEAEVVAADGEVRIANTCTNPDLFWALKGGGGFGVVTSVTLRTHALPEYFGGVFATIHANSDDAYRRLIVKTVEFCAEALFNPHWGEQIRIGRGYVAISMVFQGLDQQQAAAVWKPFFDWVAASPQDFALVSPLQVLAGPARRFWDPALLKSIPGVVIADDRPGAPAGNIFWADNLGEAGAVWQVYQSAWQDAPWGENYARLRVVKDKYDPGGLFFLHHGVGSEDWSADGFRRTN
jgi:hypothetical protein